MRDSLFEEHRNKIDDCSKNWAQKNLIELNFELNWQNAPTKENSLAIWGSITYDLILIWFSNKKKIHTGTHNIFFHYVNVINAEENSYLLFDFRMILLFSK